jgi:RNA polymerase sigma factor (sigma-70 family)
MDLVEGIADTDIAAGADPEVVALVHVTRGRELWTLGRSLGLSEDEADDAVQEALARLWRELRGGAAIRDPEAWAFRLVYRLAMDNHRVRRRVTALVDRLAGDRHDRSVDITTRLAVWDEVRRLPERQRAVLYLRYRSDLTFDRIGEALSITPSAARSYASTGVATIRDALARADGSER